MTRSERQSLEYLRRLAPIAIREATGLEQEFVEVRDVRGMITRGLAAGRSFSLLSPTIGPDGKVKLQVRSLTTEEVLTIRAQLILGRPGEGNYHGHQ
jgi:hypothetical protein